MNRKRNLIIATLILGSFFGSHALVVQSITNPARSVAETNPQSDSTGQEQLPDFASITDIPSRKQAFFDFLTPMVDTENRRLSTLRQSLPNLSTTELIKLADEYGVAADSPDLTASLTAHIDEIPRSLVLAQAAIESAWGTSRFARTGNNLFGEWCFSKGCGMVPQSRAANATHEVKRFKSAEASVRSYMRNLNRHRAYQKLREQRTEQRTNHLALNGCVLATGLQSYSQKGMGYVEMVKSLIRNNQLESNKAPCAPMKAPTNTAEADTVTAEPTPTAKGPTNENTLPNSDQKPNTNNNDSA